MVKLSVVIPTYMEAGNVGELLLRLKDSLSSVDHEIIIVDDDSPDGTADIAESYGRRYGGIKVVRRIGRRGIGSALKEGLKMARGEYVAVMDADLQHPPELLPSMLGKADDGFDVVVASRYAEGGGVEGWSLFRRVVSKVASVIAKLLIPETRRVTDPLSGFFLVRRSLLEEVEVTGLSCKILLEVLAGSRGLRVGEVPFKFTPRLKGRSKLGIGEWLRYLIHVVKISGYRTLKFISVGLSGVAVNMGLLWILLKLTPVWVSSPIAIEASILNNFVLNDLWTFRRRRTGRWLSRLIKYHGAVAVGGVTNYVILLALTFTGLNPMAANLIGIVSGFTANYLLSEVAVWV